MMCLSPRNRALLCAVCCLMAGPALAETPAAGETGPDVRQAVEEFCIAMSDEAAERRMATQTAALKDLESRIENRMALLEKTKTEVEALIKRREELRKLAGQELVEIYAGMDPEAASLQLEQIDVRLASSVLRQLKPRQASAILNEMKPELAARMAKAIASAAGATKETP